MHFLKVVVPLLLPSVLAVTFTDVQSDLTIVDGDANDLTTAFNGFTGTGSQTLAILNLFSKLRKDLDKAGNDTVSATTPSAAATTSVYTYTSGKLLTDTKAWLVAEGKKTANLKAAGLKSVVCSANSDFETRYGKVIDALTVKGTSTDLKTKYAATKKNYNAAFDALSVSLSC